jgi:hypothetical protein
MSADCVAGGSIGVSINPGEFVAELGSMRGALIKSVPVSDHSTNIMMDIFRVDFPNYRSGDVTAPSQILSGFRAVNIGESLCRPSYCVERIGHNVFACKTAHGLIEVSGGGIPAISPDGHSLKIPVVLSWHKGIVQPVKINESAVYNRILFVGVAGNFGLLVHDCRLSGIDAILESADNHQHCTEGETSYHRIAVKNGIAAAVIGLSFVVAGCRLCAWGNANCSLKRKISLEGLGLLLIVAVGPVATWRITVVDGRGTGRHWDPTSPLLASIVARPEPREPTSYKPQ